MKNTSKLLVEGKDDLHIISALCKKHLLKENFEIKNCEGKDNILKLNQLDDQLSIEFKGYERKTIGIVLDTDFDLDKKLNKIKEILKNFDFLFPNVFPKEGLILSNEKDQKIGIWMMPNNELNGMIEDFVSLLIPKDDKLFAIASEVLQNIESQNLNKYSLIHHSKAKIQTWLAWQENPGTPMGQAITKKYLETNHETCDLFLNWLNKMFNT